MTLPFSSQPPRYRTNHDYSFGVLSKSTAMDACDGSPALVTVDVDIDASTGLEDKTASAPESETEFMNFLVNVTSHGVGHATGALPQYSKDAAPVGSFLNPSGFQAEPGSVMETNVDAEVVGREARDFSPADADQLQETLNDLPPE